MSTRDLDRLATAVKKRRLELYPSRLAAAKAAGVSKDTWRKVEEGDPAVRETSYAKMDQALHWMVGSCTTILTGGEPVAVDHQDGVDVVHTPQSMLPEDVRIAVTDAAMAVTPGLTLGDVQALSTQVVEELRRRGILPPTPQG
jgi:hypothetical protein